MHSLDIAVHPWPMMDDYLRYRKTAYGETNMYLKMGSDGLFVEFPADSYRWFTENGSMSTLDFDHPDHKLESKDLILEMTKTCIGDRHKLECMSYETLFGGAVRTNAFLSPRGRATCRNEHE
jgi:hypothetical protein